MSLHFPASPRLRGLAAAALFVSVPLAASAAPTTVLFVGNSFTYGEAAGGPDLVRPYRPSTVTDLVGTNIGGVPALFKQMTVERGLDWNVSLETQGGVGVDYHYNNRFALIDKPWDHVVLQSYSTLDANRPGDPATLIRYSGLLANSLFGRNPNVDIHLDATWSRADQTYKVTTSPWFGKDIYAMETDVSAGYHAAKAANPHIDDVIETGDAWARAMMAGFADTNPYDGITPGQVDLWAPEAYHASVFGYYLEALMFFGSLTNLDPQLLGYDQVAMDLGITSAQAIAMQGFAAQALALAVPEPGTVGLLIVGLLAVGAGVRRKRD